MGDRETTKNALLSVAEMGRADAAAIAGGTPGATLMQNAGAAVAAAVQDRWAAAPTVVLCGPGNNGGDGFVAARLLADAGWPVRVALLGAREALKGDAAHHAELWQGAVLPLAADTLDEAAVVVDALFGAGLSRPLDGAAAATVAALNTRRGQGAAGVVAVDVPSGVHGDSGKVLGADDDPAAACAAGLAVAADATVTFFRRKPGHLLYPGRGLCGALTCADIGIPAAVLDAVAPATFANAPALWRAHLPRPNPALHKYSRGLAVIAGGGRMTGAARLAARGAMRAGAGMVRLAVPPEAVLHYAAALETAVVVGVRDTAGFAELVQDPRAAAALLGPGLEVTGSTRERVLAALKTGKPVVLDADALSVFAETPELLFESIAGTCLLTPHDGEFARLFGKADGGDRLARARAAAVRSGAVVLLKGPDTVIAAPDGRAAINENAPPDLATAGAGDVLGGIAVGLAAQGMPMFEAACAAAWMHGAAAQAAGPGLIASDLPDALPAVWRDLRGDFDDGG
jgi:NAD(P)H-hydrate epimerase